jgi:hypothetical protein
LIFLATFLATSSGGRGWVGAVVTNPSLRQATSALVSRSAPGSAGVVGDELTGRACGGVESVVPRREENVAAFEVQGACEVDSVVAAQGVSGGEAAGLAGEWFVDRDDA